MRSDFELLAAWRQGDRPAASELFTRHFGPIYSFFRNKLEEAAEDLTQQTFMRCVQARDDFRGSSSFRTYLFVVARSVLYDHLRRKAGRDVVDFEVTSLEDLGISPSSLLAVREDQKLLVHALRRLPIDLQIALELYYVQQLRGQDLVDALAIPEGTVRSRIRRGLEQLRAGMAELAQRAPDIRTTLTDLERWAAEVRAAPVRTPDVRE
jgi:RNA polymerase sigma-70 factor (ECF subfamily)